MSSRKPLTARAKIALSLALLVVLALIASLIIRVPYVILRPGEAPNTLGELDGKKILTVSGTKTYPTSGGLHFTTVALYGGPDNRPSALEWLAAKTSDTAEIYPESAFFAPTDTKAQVQKQNQADMTNSQSSAEVVAARAAGFTVPEKIEVAAVLKGSDAAKVVKVGDIITSVNATQIKDSPGLAAAMKKVTPGDAVKLGITRGGKAQTLTVKTRKLDGRAIMGLGLNPHANMPFNVTMNVGDVGGPSAGLMFTLAIYDEVTPGALTGGKQIAGTGEMSASGEVGAIGGVREKIVGAKESNATSFLTPAANCAELKGHVPDGITAYRVSTITDAISVVKKIAANDTKDLATCG